VAGRTGATSPLLLHWSRWARRAIEYYEQALAISREIGDLRAEPIDCFNLALRHAEQGNVAQALPLAGEAARLFAEIGHAAYTQRARELVAQLEG
jgi:tetratricopeptide (TPR) repeat protein